MDCLGGGVEGFSFHKKHLQRRVVRWVREVRLPQKGVLGKRPPTVPTGFFPWPPARGLLPVAGAEWAGLAVWAEDGRPRPQSSLIMFAWGFLGQMFPKGPRAGLFMDESTMWKHRTVSGDQTTLSLEKGKQMRS